MFKPLAAILLIAMCSFAFAGATSYSERFTNWDRFTVTQTEELYGTATVTIPSIFGTLRNFNYTNTGGADMNVSLWNDAGTLIYNRTVAPAGTFSNRDTLNSTILGSATATFVSKFGTGGSLATYTAYCPIDTNATATSCTTGGANLSTNGGNSIIVGKFGNATKLDGLTGYMTYANTTALNFSGSAGASLSFWMKDDSPLNNTYIWHQGGAANDTTVRLARGVNNSGAYVTKTGSDWNITFVANKNISTPSITYNATTQLTDDQWHHYVYSVDNTTMALFVDGIKVVNTTFTSAMTNASTNNYHFGDGATNVSCTIHSPPSSIEPVNCAYEDFAFDEIYAFPSVLAQGNVSYLFNATKRTSGSMVLIMRQ